MKQKSAGRLLLVGSGLGLAYGLAILLSLDGVPLAAGDPVAARDGAKAAKWVLVEVKVNPGKKAVRKPQIVEGKDRGGYLEIKYTPNSYTCDCVFKCPLGRLVVDVHHTWSFEVPPAELTEGQELTLVAKGTANDTLPAKGSASWGRYSAQGISCQQGRVLMDGKEFPHAEYPKFPPESAGQVGLVFGPLTIPVTSASTEYHFHVAKDTKEEFIILLGGRSEGDRYDGFAEYRYQRVATPRVKTPPLSARLECGTVTLTLGRLPSEVCGLNIKGWRGNTSDPVEVIFPDQQNQGGSVGGGIVVFEGTTKLDPSSMNREEHYLPIFWRAHCPAIPGVFQVPIIVRQKDAGEVNLTQTVRVLAERSPVPGKSPLAGSFKTTLGNLTLKVNGNQATGTFTRNGGSLSGTVTGDVFVGTWTDQTGSGKITLFPPPHGKGLAGDWLRSRGTGDRSGHLDGTATDGTLPPGSDADVSITIDEKSGPIPPQSPGTQDPPLQPPCSGKGKQTVADAQCCLKMWVGLKPVGMQMDIDRNGVVDSRDAILVLQNVAKGLAK